MLALLAVREGMRITIAREVESLLQEEVLELELAIKELSPDQRAIDDEFARKILGHSRHDWFAQLSDGDKTIWKSDNLPSIVSSQVKIPNVEGTSFLTTDRYLIVAHRFPMTDGSVRTILLGEPNEFIRNDVWQLTKIMLYIGIALLVVAPVGGFLLAWRAIHPVREIISTTRSLDPTHLESRLKIRGTGDELDQISAEINSFVDQISNYVNSQRDFVANAAHELRSPIAAILASVDVTLSKQRTTTEYEDELVTIGKQCRDLSFLVNQLLDLAETESSHPAVVEPIDFADLVRKSVDMFCGIADEKDIALVSQLASDVVVSGDPLKLFQVVNNLVDNAVKFTPPNGKIEVHLDKSNSRATLSITNSGQGVPEELLERIFDRFFQVDQSRERKEFRGNGLGLSICKSIVRQSNGKVSATNTPGGFCVRVGLPISS